MFQCIQIKNIGPHKELNIELDKEGNTLIIGRSESGKTTIVEAICFALWGIGADGKAFEKKRFQGDPSVTLTTRSGNVIHRSFDLEKGKHSRSLTKRGEDPVLYETEADWLKALGSLGRPELRVAMCPMSWIELVNGPGEGRPFRDFLIQILPNGDQRAEVARLMTEAGYELLASDVIKASDAEANRKAEKSMLERAIGALEQAEAAAEMGAPDAAPEKPVQAEKTIAAWETWQKYRVERSKYDAVNGIEPVENVSEEVLESLRSTFEEQKRSAEAKRDQQAKLKAFPEVHPEQFRTESEVARLGKELAAMEGAGDTCPTCKRAGWSEAAHAVDGVRLRLDAAVAYAADLKNVHGAKRKALQELVDLHPFSLDDYSAAEAALAEAVSLRKAYTKYEAAKKMLPKEPNPPLVAEPSAEAVEAAKRELEEYQRRSGAVQEFEKRSKQAQAAVKKAAQDVKELKASVERAEALVAACRAAPSNIAKRQEEALGDLGPISFEYKAKGGIEISIDGRAWWLASTGRRICADAVLRIALRKAMNAVWLPLFVDEIQSWTGDLPEFKNGILLKTEDRELGVFR